MEKSQTNKRIDDLSGRVGRFEDAVDQRFDKVDRRFDRFEDKVDARFDRIEARLERWGKTVTGGVMAIAAGVILKLLGA